MTIQRTSMVGIALLMLASTAASQGARLPEARLRAAMDSETVDGDLGAAIDGYKQVIDHAGADRGVVAQALLRLGMAYEKHGDVRSAHAAYERLAGEFGAQTALAQQARARMALTAPASSGQTASEARAQSATSSQPGSGTAIRELQTGRAVRFATNDTPRLLISPNGRYILGDGVRFGLRDLSADTNRLLGDQKAGYAWGGSFSRDEKELAYTWALSDDEYELRVINLEGADVPQPRTLLANKDIFFYEPRDWTPDKRSVITNVWHKDGSSQTVLVSTSDGSMRQLRKEASAHAFLSSDGRYLAFSRRTGEPRSQQDVAVFSLENGREETLVAEPTNDVVMGWSPDGRYVLFASERAPGSVTNLWALPFAGGKADGARKLVQSDIGPADSLGVTSSGALYYRLFSGVRQHVQAGALDFDSGTFTPSISFADAVEGSDPLWSPDGKFIAFRTMARGLDGLFTTLTIRSVETGVQQVLRPALFERGFDSNFWVVAWAPDGRSLFATGKDPENREGLYRIDAQTGSVTLVLAKSECGCLDWIRFSRDARRVFYHTDTSDADTLIARDLASGTENVLVERAGINFFSPSPDGRSIAVGFDGAIHVIPVAGGQPRELAPGNAALWAPDSRSLLVRNQGGVHRVSIDGQSRAVTTEPLLLRNLGGADVSRDGRVAFHGRDPEQSDGPPTIRVIENLMSKLESNP